MKISVIDTGIGIPKEKQSKLFKLFGFTNKNKNDTMNQNGIGLGLVISELIVGQFGGAVTFDSEAGKGSTFTFTFKLKPLKEIEDGGARYDSLGSQKSEEDEQAAAYLDKANLVYEWKPEQGNREDVKYKFLMEDKSEFIGQPKKILVVDD